MLSYYTFFTKYSGTTPEDVVQAIYADAKAGMGMSLDEWGAYQSKLWDNKYGQRIPQKDAPDAAKKLLAILVKLGALETSMKDL
ncbi:MAG: hypothetical protein HY052_08785 [Proteobacteria bacterium]|nr:hypothetical protein [Pseudomonadota bacterium]